MKMKILIASVLLAVSAAASAMTFWNSGVLMGNVCRSGVYYTVYPSYMAQPVGSSCPVRDGFGTIIGWGIVSDE